MNMSDIKFGTDGWRAIIAKDYTIENLERISEGTAKWMLLKKMKQVVVGYDSRFGGKMFSETVVRVFGNYGIKSILSTGFVSTPMVSLATVKTKSDLGIVITASHNPPEYNGFKLKSAFGGPSSPADIAEVESLIPGSALVSFPSLEEISAAGLLEMMDMEQMYIDHVHANFDMKLIDKTAGHLAYDAMFGAGQNAGKRIFPKARFLHCEYNPSFLGQAPEPIDRNLKMLKDLVASDKAITMGLANDGDADRIGLYDEDGQFVDSHHILLLLLHYYYQYKKLTGKVVITFSVTDKMKKMAELFGLPVEITKIGFKYIAEIMTQEDVLVGGEESGGLAVKGHIPERDGIWIGLVIMEYMGLTGKSIKQLIQDVYDLVGSFYCDRDDLHITNDLKLEIMDRCKTGQITRIGDRPVIRTEDLDGYKFYVSEDEFIMVRASGTEPVLRVYGQAPDYTQVRQLIEAAKSTLLA